MLFGGHPACQCFWLNPKVTFSCAAFLPGRLVFEVPERDLH